MSCPLEFTLDSRPVRVEGVSPNTTPLESWRGRGRTGSKEDCAGGDYIHGTSVYGEGGMTSYPGFESGG